MNGDASSFYKLFPTDKIPMIFSAIVSASNFLYRKNECEHEVRISRRLHKLLILNNPFRDGPLTIHLEPEVPDTDMDVDNPGGKIDFVVPSTSGYHAYFAIEAKRLRYKSTSGKLKTGHSYYIDGGVMRFVNGQYAPYTQTGAMLGYVFDGRTELVLAGIRNLVRKRMGQLRISTAGGLQYSHSINGTKIHITEHSLNGRKFLLYHLFLTVPLES